MAEIIAMSEVSISMSRIMDKGLRLAAGEDPLRGQGLQLSDVTPSSPESCFWKNLPVREYSIGNILFPRKLPVGAVATYRPELSFQSALFSETGILGSRNILCEVSQCSMKQWIQQIPVTKLTAWLNQLKK